MAASDLPEEAELTGTWWTCNVCGYKHRAQPCEHFPSDFAAYHRAQADAITADEADLYVNRPPASDLPAEAVEAAADAIWSDKYAHMVSGSRGYAATLAQIAVSAAAPHLRAQVLAEVDAAQLAQTFHETYERLAPDYGYRTREASAKPWADVPEQNRALMVATCAAVIEHLRDTLGAGGDGEG